jgi:hypothetical protein
LSSFSLHLRRDAADRNDHTAFSRMLWASFDSACADPESDYYMGRRSAVAAYTYKNALEIAESLSPEDRLRLLEELKARVAKDVPPEPKHSIMELCGLGAEIWEGIDAQEYVNRERASW